MENTKMNRELGTKWFTFYTKVRPWLSCIGFISVLVDFVQYTETYFTFWWLLLHFASNVAHVVVAIITFVKSREDYGKFVTFVNKVLIFETLFFSYQAGLNQFINNFELMPSLITGAVLLLLYYLLWYRLNIKYFKKRILTEAPVTVSYDIYDNNSTLTASAQVKYCSNCGNELVPNTVFCNNCGSKINR